MVGADLSEPKLRAEGVLCYLRSSDLVNECIDEIGNTDHSEYSGPLCSDSLSLLSSETNMEKQTDGIDRTVY